MKNSVVSLFQNQSSLLPLTIQLFLTILLSLPLTANADLNLAPPDQLLVKAAKGKMECRDVVLDLFANVSEMRDPQTFDAYFGIIDRLHIIAQQVQLDTVYPDAIKNLGIKMSANGVRWLSAAKDPIEKIIYYHRWMTLDTAYVFFASVDTDATQIDDDVALKKLAENVDKLLVYLPLRFIDNRDLPQGYRRIISELAGRKLQNRQISESDFLFWLGKLSVASGYGLALDALQASVMELNRDTIKFAHLLGRRLRVVADRIRTSSIAVPSYLKNQLDDIVVALIDKQLVFSEKYEDGEFQTLLDLLNRRGLASLAQTWATVDRLPSSEFSKEYLGLSRLILERLQAEKLEKEAADFASFIGRVTAPIVIQSTGAEGTYRLINSTGRVWIFNIVMVKNSQIAVALSDSEWMVNKSYFAVDYNVKELMFVGSQRDVDTDPQANLTVHFQIRGNGKIYVRDLSADPDQQELRGEKIENYPDFFQKGKGNSIVPAGIYKGVVTFAKNHPMQMTMVVTSFNGHTLARLTPHGKGFYVDFNIGTRGTDGVLYLTTGRITGGSWVQLRGLVTEREFRGFAINGGRGIAVKEFVLKRVKN